MSYSFGGILRGQKPELYPKKKASSSDSVPKKALLVGAGYPEVVEVSKGAYCFRPSRGFGEGRTEYRSGFGGVGGGVVEVPIPLPLKGIGANSRGNGRIIPLNPPLKKGDLIPPLLKGARGIWLLS